MPRSAEYVVVGLDQSDHARAAVRWAVQHAQRCSLALRVVHAYEPTRVAAQLPIGYAPGYALEVDQDVAQDARELLDQTVRELVATHPDVPVDAELAVGSAVRALLAASTDAAVLVVGSRGHGGFAGLLLGSTALHVAGHARCPVVAVPWPDNDTRSGVVVGVDGSEVSTAAIEWAFHAADELGEPLTAVHAWTDPRFHDVEEETLITETLARWREKYPDVSVCSRIVPQHPVSALLEAGRTASLIVVGSHGRGALRSLVLGSVGHGLLHYAHVPVAIVRPSRS